MPNPFFFKQCINCSAHARLTVDVLCWHCSFVSIKIFLTTGGPYGVYTASRPTREVFLGSILSHLSNPLARTTDLQHSLSFVNLRTELPSSLLPTAAARGAPRHDQRSLVSLRKQCQNVALPIIRKTTSQAPSFILLDTEANSSH